MLAVSMNKPTLLPIYRQMLTAREIDKISREITQRGEAFFHLSGAGHEASVALAPHLTDDDWLHCHYRDKALLLARGLSVRSFFDSMLCNDRSSSRGRRMSAFFSDPKLKILSMVTPTGNNALQAVGVESCPGDRFRYGASRKKNSNCRHQECMSACFWFHSRSRMSPRARPR